MYNDITQRIQFFGQVEKCKERAGCEKTGCCYEQVQIDTRKVLKRAGFDSVNL